MVTVRPLWIGGAAFSLAVASLVDVGSAVHEISAQAVGQPYRLFAIQVAKTPAPIGARCNDHTFHEYTGPTTCDGHGGVHYWIYPGNE